MEKSSYNIAMTSLDHVKLSTKDVIFKDWWTSDVSVAYVPTIANTYYQPVRNCPICTVNNLQPPDNTYVLVDHSLHNYKGGQLWHKYPMRPTRCTITMNTFCSNTFN